MGHTSRLSPPGLLALARHERAHPWTMVLDGAVLLGVLVWVTLSATRSLAAVPLALYSALLVGTIMHRAFVLMEASAHPDLDGDATEEARSARSA